MDKHFWEYFTIAYGQEWQISDSALLKETINKLENEGLDLYAFLLACTQRNLDIYQKLELPYATWLPSSYLPIQQESMKLLQLAILHILYDFSSPHIFHEILQRLVILKQEGILSLDEERYLRGFLHQLVAYKNESRLQGEKREGIAHEKGKDLLSYALMKLQAIHNDIAENFPKSATQKELTHIIQTLATKDFSIGITGVMNAGKSTFLNALLGRELLGTSIIPETANLTILHFSKEEYARVHFWKKAQWEEITQSARFSAGIARFVEDSHTIFGNRLEEFITQEGRILEIPIDELSTYTSAKHPSKLCNLTKFVEIFTPLALLEGRVELVDTPGLDDPITQREEITKNYLENCDMILHLMNAAQSATHKDVEFLVDMLTHKRVSHLLIVLTRIDTLSKEEIQSSMQYTIQTISQRLHKLGEHGVLAELTKRLIFIPLAAKAALEYRTGKQSLKEGYTLEDTGILTLEAHLWRMLFGDTSPKSKILIQGACKLFHHHLNALLEEILLRKELLNKNEEERGGILAKHSKKYSVIMQEITQLEEVLGEILQGFERQVEELLKHIAPMVDKSLVIVKRRILDDIQYEYENGRKPTHERIQSMLELGIRDMSTEVVRMHWHDVMKRMHFFNQEVENRLNSMRELLEYKITEEYLNELHNLNTTQITKYSQNSAILQGAILQSIAKHHHMGESLLQEIGEAFNFASQNFCTQLKAHTSNANRNLLKRVRAINTQLFENLHAILAKQKSALLEMSESTASNQHDKEQEEKVLLHKEGVLLALQKELHQLTKESV